MKDENAVLYFQRGFLLPLFVTVAERMFLVPIRVRFEKKRFRAKQINAFGQTQFIIKRRGNIRVGKPVRTVTQYRARQRNYPSLAPEISPRTEREPGNVQAAMSHRMSVARFPLLVHHFWVF